MYTLKKSLGQHFLKDENICRRIVGTVTDLPLDNLLEVGPGGGALTKYLIQIPGIAFKAVELDEEKVVYLKKNFPILEEKIIHQSILEMELPFESSFTVVGNFPYNISTEIVFKMIEWRERVAAVVGMFQKEVAERLAAREGSKVYGVTSVLTQLYFDVAYLFEIEPVAFDPPPKVKSAVIRMTPRTEAVSIRSEHKFRMLVKAAFNQRRKTLRNAVKSYFDPAVLQDPVFNKRAEQLSVADFASLSFKMQ